MSKAMWILIGIMAMGTSAIAHAKPGGKGHQEKLQATEHSSEQGAMNANNPASGDQLKGDARSDERHAMEHDNHGKHTAKGKGQEKRKAR